MNNLSALRERVESASPSDDPIALGQIANEIAEAIFGAEYTQDHWAECARAMRSIDAAVGLIERKLPDCWWDVEREFVYDNGMLRQRCIGRIRIARDAYMHVRTAKTPALALIAALLNALENTNG